MAMEIAKYVWLTLTRPCNFCLCFEGGSVFADFDIGSDGLLYLVRISFDGYGCCVTEGKIAPMSLRDSQTIINRVDADDLNSNVVREILYRYFRENQKVIWQDALLEHQLLGPTEK
jgi:hypothetical protein